MKINNVDGNKDTYIPVTLYYEIGIDSIFSAHQFLHCGFLNTAVHDNRVTSESTAPECEPLISAHPSETYISSQAVAKAYTSYKSSKQYRWHAPELFTPSNDDLVYPCPKSDVYSLCLILWECCNATMPWKHMTYDKLKEQYTMWKTSVPLAKDGTYPGCLLSLLQSGLTIQRQERINLEVLQNTLQSVKRSLDDLGYIIIPARLPPRQTFSTNAWDTTTDSDCLSPQNIRHEAVIHNIRDSSTESEKDCSKSDSSPRYETIQKLSNITYAINEKCRITDGNIHKHPTITYDHLPEKEFSSACSTPIAKIRARIKDMETPGSLHRSDSTEYCSILSPNRTVNFAIDDSKDSIEKPSAKLSRSFTPKSYKPLHIKVPEFNFDSIKPLLKDNNNAEKSSYNFDIKNYSLPTTPIARSNKLRKNAWLSGDMGVENNNNKDMFMLPEKEELQNTTRPMLVPPTTPTDTSTESAHNMANDGAAQDTTNNNSPESVDTIRDHITGLRRINPPHDFMSPESDEATRDHTNSCSLKSHQDRNKDKIEDVLANVNVKPLVAIHERWIYEANRKTCRSLSLPDHNRSQISAVKPASHCVDTLQKSLPQLNTKKVSNKIYRTRPASPNYGKHGPQWEQFCQARDAVAKNMNFTRDPERNVWKKYNDKGLLTENPKPELKTDQSTDTSSIEEFIKDLIRKEFQHLMNEISEETSTTSNAKNEEILSKGVANIIEMLNSNEDKCKKETKSFSRVKINGNNKPLLQITFSRSGENSLQVLDNCVNVTICDNKEKNQSLEDTLIDDIQVNSLKRCQAFNALQEARSTEDLYIDDDLSTMQENFGDRVKLIPLHGSLHEILCEKEDECCLIKVKQENGCDTIYFRCDNSDTESRDAIDGQDTVVFKRSISLVEERIQRIIPKDKRTNLNFARKAQIVKNVRPKSEIFEPKLNIESRARSNSTPTLSTTDKTDEIEVNIENVVSYQDSSSDECLKCQVENDDFELIEQKIEEEYAKSNMSSLTSGYLEKISEENLSVFNEEIEKD